MVALLAIHMGFTMFTSVSMEMPHYDDRYTGRGVPQTAITSTTT